MNAALLTMRTRLAVYSVIHPGVKDFVADWYESLIDQTDMDFDLWISLDSISQTEATRWIGREVQAKWLTVSGRKTPAQIRSEAIQLLAKNYSAIIFVDSDDRLHSSRVSAARSALESNDLNGCALRLIDAKGEPLGSIFGLAPSSTPEDVFPYNNIFGLSNTVYASGLLARCLPIPANVLLVDWFLSTHAWLMGAKLGFDSTIRMDYRQYEANTARVIFPTHSEQVKKDTQLVRGHFKFVLSSARDSFLPDRLQRLHEAARNIEQFNQQIVEQPPQLQAYVESLNRINPRPLWWSGVAYPALAQMWQARQAN